MQRNLESKDSQLRELDRVQADLRQKDYQLFEAKKQLDNANIAHSASMSSAAKAMEAEIKELKKHQEHQEQQHKNAISDMKEEHARELSRKVRSVDIPMGMSAYLY